MTTRTPTTGYCRVCGALIGRDGRKWFHDDTEVPETNDHKHVPVKLENTDAFMDDAAGATALWDEGCRPRQAQYLQHGNVVAYRATDVFQLDTVGPTGFTYVEEVDLADYLRNDGVPYAGDYSEPPVRVSTSSRGVVECDDGDEVWVKVQPT